jgi:hypothetical protein
VEVSEKLIAMTTSRYGTGGRNYDQEPVWTRNSYDFQPQPRHTTSYPAVPHTHSAIGGVSNGPQHTTIVHSSIKPVPDSDIYRYSLLEYSNKQRIFSVGIYGWRKRCLYVFILLLTIVIVVNLALTIWIMTVLDFSTSGMGALKIDEDGIRVEGRSEFDRTVKFSQLSAPEVSSIKNNELKSDFRTKLFSSIPLLAFTLVPKTFLAKQQLAST